MIFDVEDLIEKGLVRKKTYSNGLSVLKYHNKVFYNNLWNTDKRLLDCRGTVIDKNNEIVSMPFTKVFNLHENGTTVDRDLKIVAPRKVNGFMAAATMHNGELLVSTTGTLDSDYAKFARKHIGDKELRNDHTYLFEICDKSDPHIVDEEDGAYFEFINGYDIITLAECEGSMELSFGIATKAQNAIKEYAKASGKEARVYLINYSF